jgi:hypothetical protein
MFYLVFLWLIMWAALVVSLVASFWIGLLLASDRLAWLGLLVGAVVIAAAFWMARRWHERDMREGTPLDGGEHETELVGFAALPHLRSSLRSGVGRS